MLVLPRHVIAECPSSPAPANTDYLGPALLSLARIPLAFLLVLTALRPISSVIPLPFLLLLFAYATDIADGWVARRWHVESQGGRNLDVFCDRVLHLAGFGVAAAYGVSVAALAALAVRDVLVTSIRVLAERSVKAKITHQRYLSLGHAGVVRLWLAICLVVGPGQAMHMHALKSLLALAILTGYTSVAYTLAVALGDRKLWKHSP